MYNKGLSRFLSKIILKTAYLENIKRISLDFKTRFKNEINWKTKKLSEKALNPIERD